MIMPPGIFGAFGGLKSDADDCMQRYYFYVMKEVLMPYLIMTSKYPSDKIPAVAERYLEILAKYPHDDSLSVEVVPSAVKSTHEGVVGIAVSDIKEGKLDAAYTRAVNSLAMFQSVEGFEYSIDIYSKADEAMAAIGMELP